MSPLSTQYLSLALASDWMMYAFHLIVPNDSSNCLPSKRDWQEQQSSGRTVSFEEWAERYNQFYINKIYMPLNLS